MSDINIVGDLTNLTTTVVGNFKLGKLLLLNYLEKKDYYLLKLNKLDTLKLDDETIKERLNINKYIMSHKLQNQIIASIFMLIDKGYKKIVFDELLTYVDYSVRESLINYLKDNNINFINITNDMEDVLLSDYLIVLHGDLVALEGKTMDVLKEEKLLNRMGLNLPFIVDLSIQLKYYGLVDKIYLNKEELVSVLWK